MEDLLGDYPAHRVGLSVDKDGAVISVQPPITTPAEMAEACARFVLSTGIGGMTEQDRERLAEAIRSLAKQAARNRADPAA